MTEVSPIWLKDIATAEPVEAELHDAISQGHIADWQTRWVPARAEGLRRLAMLRQARPQSSHWDWRNKIAHTSPMLTYRGFAIVARGETQGLMLVETDVHRTRVAPPGRPLTYVEFLEVAPWNQREYGQAPRYGGVGHALLVAAVHLSVDMGFKGRMGLASLPQSTGFYARCGMTYQGQDQQSPTLPYYEFTEAAAATFRPQKG
jgi:hypothetical protein